MPKQHRAHETVEVVLLAVVKILKRQGLGAVTTNRIAEVAGVSVGSVYQYFPDKQAIYQALHERHIGRSTALLERVLIDCASAPLETFIRTLMEALIDAHASDPELYELLRRDVPCRADHARRFEERVYGALRLALGSRTHARLARGELERRLFVTVHMVDALVHAAALDRPPGLSLSVAKSEAVRAVLLYLRSP